jgi:hypothetical protein
MLRVPRILLALPAVAAVTRAATFCSLCLHSQQQQQQQQRWVTFESCE